ncbi:unnamed protein product [Diatraea saccharalis]|uniref:Uncharacterized protein n=1 Tax=Diatraea saccharalis TaxID=40085 RepID=A0A9N9QZW2_9NEOP|nr:unnamed protein product [Diatraea saccharalis]
MARIKATELSGRTLAGITSGHTLYIRKTDVILSLSCGDAHRKKNQFILIAFKFFKDLNDIILHASDVMMLTNILTNLFTGYVDGYSYRRVILDPFKIFSRYLKSWLALDILSAASFLPHLLNIQNVTHQIILTSLKILRIPPLYRYLENINRAYRSGVSKGFIGVFSSRFTREQSDLAEFCEYG